MPPIPELTTGFLPIIPLVPVLAIVGSIKPSLISSSLGLNGIGSSLRNGGLPIGLCAGGAIGLGSFITGVPPPTGTNGIGCGPP